MVSSIRPFLMFQGDAEAALALYATVFPDARIEDVVRHPPGGPGKEGAIQRARLVIAGQSVMVFDSPPVHAFTFTPAFSFFVTCESEEELRRIAGALGEGGQAMMPLQAYDFARLFTWFADRYGISWQLSLP